MDWTPGVRKRGILWRGALALMLASTIGVAGLAEKAHAVGVVTAVSQFFQGQKNQISDNLAEYFIDRTASPTSIDTGDIVLGVAGFDTVENLTGGGAIRGFGPLNPTINELTFLLAAKVGVNTVDPFGALVSTLVPLTAADLAALPLTQISAGLKAFLALRPVGTLVTAYDDSAQDYTRLLSGVTTDDCDVGHTGADVGMSGAGCFVAEESLVATATGGILRLDLGFTGPGGIPTATEFLFAPPIPSDALAGHKTTAGGLLPGRFNGGLDITGANTTGYAFSPVDGLLGPVQFAFSGSIVGVGGLGSTPNNTPFDQFGNVDVVFLPLVNAVPEPSTLGLMLLGTLMLGWSTVRRRQSK